ncbi:MAG TPA: patatin-like phospholipase family protein [Woeseiaceae bacterium]|nr:patatin-like phospholipase family protein [Woeseiaceae bacterium]
MTTGFIRIASLLLLITGVLSQVIAAEVPVPSSEHEPPRIGLVLGGGGARGAAHIGVLKMLEQMRIPVHAIAGTSMGAIIGGLYASGVAPDELERVIASLDWTDAFQDTAQREDLTYRRKQDDVEFPIDFELGLNDGRLELPMGLIQGQKLGLILRNLTTPVAQVRHFDDLPIPFRAVASDIETGEAYVMSEGDLPLAMRASMSAPGIFAPVVVDGRTLVDGGLSGNVPVEALRQMDVDVIIAVDVEFPLHAAEELESALDITAQMVTILIRKETRRQLESLDEDDVLIRPELGDFGSANFAEITEAVEPGAVAARNAAERLRRYALDEDAYRQYQSDRRMSREQTYVFDFVRVIDEGPLSERVLKSRLRTEPGEEVTDRGLAADAARLYGLDLYSQVSYSLVREGDRLGVEFHTKPKGWGPNILQFGMFIEDDFEGSTAFNVSARFTRAGVNPLGAEWRTDLQIGTEPYLTSEFYQPLSYDSRWFVAPRIDLEQTNFNAFADGDSIARFRVSSGEVAVDLGRELERWGEVRLGAFRGTGNARVKVGDPSIPNIDFRTGGFYASFGIDTLDDAHIPRSGSRVDATFTASRPGFGADSSFDTVEAAWSTVWTRGRHSLQLGVDFQTTIQSDDLIQNFFPLGGFLRLSGLERGEISGPHAGLARLVYYRRSGETGGGLFDIPLYLGASLEGGNAWQTRSEIAFDSLLVNGSLFAGYDTYFGPLFLGAGFSEDGETGFYLFLGALPR